MPSQQDLPLGFTTLPGDRQLQVVRLSDGIVVSHFDIGTLQPRRIVKLERKLIRGAAPDCYVRDTASSGADPIA